MNRHITEFLRLKCAPQLLEWRMFPNSKEITESMGAFDAVRRFRNELGVEFNDTDVLVIVPGDGHMPRTGALFAMRTAWDVVSVDPELTTRDFPVKRLYLYRTTAGNYANMVNRLDDTTWRVLLIVAVHSHAPMDELFSIAKAFDAERTHLITIPCCVDHNIKNRPYIGYRDQSITSPKNEIKMWLDIQEWLR